jgi:hypothetical protein
VRTVPHFMLSSTFYDLRQIRADLAHFISADLGCVALLSEWSSFPVDPDVDTIENCRRRVELEADILVLVIGGRYGSVDSQSARSITNLEYLTARAKGIPIYAFVDRQVMAVLPVWKANKTANFSTLVDDPRVFGFIEEVRNTHKVWTTEFDLAQDIVVALRSQTANLLLRGSELARRARSDEEYSVLRTLQGRALRIALERSSGWEHKLFSEILMQEVNARRVLSEQKRLSITYGAYDWVKASDLESWYRPRMAELEGLIQAIEGTEIEIARAVGEPGRPGDLALLVFTARSIGAIYQEALEWVLRVRRVAGDAKIKKVAQGMDRFVDDILTKIETLGPRLLEIVVELEGFVLRGESVPARALVVKIDLPGVDEAVAAIQAMAAGESS